MKKRVPDKFWFPWWPDKWIFGSMRIECTVEERAIWVDLLSLASKDNGFIRANEEIPYPLEQLAGMLRIPEDIFIKAIEKFINLKDKDGKGKLTKMKDGTLYVTTWEDYQFSRTAKFYAEKGRGEQKCSHSEQESEEYITLDNSKLNHNKLEDTKCNYILNLLSKVKDYPFNEKRDQEFIVGLIADFPDLDALEEIKKKCAWWLSNPILKKSNPHLQIRNWFINARKYLKEGDKSRDVGKSYMKEKEFLPMILLGDIYKIILARGESIEGFYDLAKSVFPKIKDEWEKSDKKPETFIRLVEGQ